MFLRLSVNAICASLDRPWRKPYNWIVSARLALLGALELRRDGVPVGLPLSAQRLLAYVALQGKLVSRAYVSGHLWPDASDVRAGANLRSALWRLHRAAGDVMLTDGSGLQLASSVSIDVDRMTAVASGVVAGDATPGEDEIEQLCRADDVLPDWYDEWVALERERFRQLRLHALERLCERLTAEGRFSQALTAGLAALRAEPLRETAHRAMIGLHLAEGNVGEAMRQYDSCERQMAKELGLRPSPQTARLLDDAIAARRPQLRTALPQ
jgi:DNA-binding SARP family transcriptional activator